MLKECHSMTYFFFLFIFFLVFRKNMINVKRQDCVNLSEQTNQSFIQLHLFYFNLNLCWCCCCCCSVLCRKINENNIKFLFYFIFRQEFECSFACHPCWWRNQKSREKKKKYTYKNKTNWLDNEEWYRS